jgi:hypothetical protein
LDLIWSAIPQKPQQRRHYHGYKLPEHDLKVDKQALDFLVKIAELREQFTGFGPLGIREL